MSESQTDKLFNLIMVLGAFGVAAFLSSIGDKEHAGMLICGALGMAIPMSGKKIPGGSAAVVGLAIGASVLLGGCTGAQVAEAGTIAHTAARVTCGVVQRAATVCRDLGLSPSESCPLPVTLDVTVGDEE